MKSICKCLISIHIFFLNKCDIQDPRFTHYNTSWMSGFTHVLVSLLKSLQWVFVYHTNHIQSIKQGATWWLPKRKHNKSMNVFMNISYGIVFGPKQYGATIMNNQFDSIEHSLQQIPRIIMLVSGASVDWSVIDWSPSLPGAIELGALSPCSHQS